MNRERSQRRRIVALVALALLLAAAVCAFGDDLARLLQDRERVQAWVVGFGPWGPLVTIALNAAQVLLAPIPGQTIGLVNGYLFGVALGTLYSLIGVQIGSVLAMVLARWFGRPLVVRFVAPEQLERWDQIARKQGATFFFLVFLFPFVPDDVICFIIGLSPLPIPYLLLLAAIGRLPGLVAASWIGANATTLPWWSWPLMGLGAIVLVVIFGRYREQMEDAVTRATQRLSQYLERHVLSGRQEVKSHRQDDIDDQ